MERELLLSVIGGRAIKFVTRQKPSALIPFRGEFPLLQPYQQEKYFEAIQNNEKLEDISEEFQRITEKGNRIALFEEGFSNFLSDKGISVETFKSLKNTEKSDNLLEWLNKDCIDFSQLTIK